LGESPCKAYRVDFGDDGFLLGVEDGQFVILVLEPHCFGHHTPIVEVLEFSMQGVEQMGRTDQQLSEPSRHRFIWPSRGISWVCMEFSKMGGHSGPCIWPQHGDGSIGHWFEPFWADGEAVSNRNGERGVVVIIFDIAVWGFLKGLSDLPHFVFKVVDPLMEQILLDSPFFFALLDHSSKVDNDLMSIIE
jgi:hypothetical protein